MFQEALKNAQRSSARPATAPYRSGPHFQVARTIAPSAPFTNLHPIDVWHVDFFSERERNSCHDPVIDTAVATSSSPRAAPEKAAPGDSADAQVQTPRLSLGSKHKLPTSQRDMKRSRPSQELRSEEEEDNDEADVGRKRSRYERLGPSEDHIKSKGAYFKGGKSEWE